MTPRVFEFTLWLAADDRDLLSRTNALHEAGADDCSPGEHCGKPYAAFHREAPSFEEAVRTAIRDVDAAGCHVVRCELDERQLAGMEDSFPSCHDRSGDLSYNQHDRIRRLKRTPHRRAYGRRIAQPSTPRLPELIISRRQPEVESEAGRAQP